MSASAMSQPLRSDLQTQLRADSSARLVLADQWEERGRDDVARLWADRLPPRAYQGQPRARVDKLTEAERSRFAEWVEKWRAIGLSTTPADRPRFEAAVHACYRLSGLPPPRVVWAPSPVVVGLAGPLACWLRYGASVGDSVHASVHASVGDSVERLLAQPLPSEARAAVERLRWQYDGGQFWVGGWWGSPAYVSFFLDVLRLNLPQEIQLRARAYAATTESACWWWPARDFVIVSERPKAIEWREPGVYTRENLTRVAWDGWEVTP